ncbi:hypothetical protein ACFSKU_00920 [Pontibacter silvestris]|uniref:Uncharacterized protein n=1 Tax=Pontibacter silvestris TaxID=2305183 RepID=A0ABW4WSN7_9BACT|nr:hypothetical protein [Pontibacter silvestris]MCC9136171.1 hypothetical protein [Pontibacter silvestris]
MSEAGVQEWPSGKVVLTSGDTLYGELVLHRAEEVLNVIHDDGTISSFSPISVEYFIAQDRPSGRPYYFRTLMWDQGRDYTDFKKPTFFEQLIEGPITLVMRESYLGKAGFQNNYNNQNYLPANGWVEDVKESYYAVLPDGEVVTLRRIRRDLNALFGDKSKEVRKFVKKRNLEYERPHQLIAIVSFFNSLVDPLYISKLQGVER